MDFAVLADHRETFKDGDRKDKYLDLTWELKKNEEQESDVSTKLVFMV